MYPVVKKRQMICLYFFQNRGQIEPLTNQVVNLKV